MTMKQQQDSGASVGFILVTMLSGTVQIFVRDMLAVIFPNSVLYNERIVWVTILVEFFTIYLPVEASVTFANAQTPHILLCTTVILTAVTIVTLSSYRENLPQSISELSSLRMCERRVSVTYVRSFTYVLAALCILAVDFPIFPKHEIKSKHYGTTFMDAGVGLFVVCGAMVGPRARNKLLSTRQELIDASIMIVLGICRLILVTWTGYEVSVIEYGVHWNFFFTLAFVKVFSTLLYSALSSHVIPFLGPIILLLYQYCLSRESIYKFVMFGAKGHHSRSNFIDSNREGIFSSVGFLALYCHSSEIGRFLMTKREKIMDWCGVLVVSVGGTYVAWMIFSLSVVYFDQPSRQLANAAYVYFILVLIGGITSVAIILESVTVFLYLMVRSQGMKDVAPVYSETPGLRAVNSYGLFYFLIANLLTGAINILIDTRGCTAVSSYCIVTTYMFFLSSLALYLDRRKIYVKAILLRPIGRVHVRDKTLQPGRKTISNLESV